MLYGVLPTKPVSDMRIRQAKILEELDSSPVLLTDHGRGAAVLVHPRVWNDVLSVYQMAVDAGLVAKRFGPITDFDSEKWAVEDESAVMA